MRVRFEAMKILLIEEPRMPNEEIAHILRFADASHMSSSFVRFAACTPGEYRRKFLDSVRNLH